MKSKSIIKITLIFLIIVFIALVILLLMKNNSVKNEHTNVIKETKDNISTHTVDTEDLEPVKSATAFFTVQNCVNKYIDYATSKNEEGIYKVLDSEYITEKKITPENVLSKIQEFDEGVYFTANKMYLEQIDDNNIKYYSYGFLSKEHGDGDENSAVSIEKDDFNIIVILNIEEMTFSIIPM